VPVVQQANRDIRDLTDVHARSENYGTELLDGCVDTELPSGRRHGEHHRVDEEEGWATQNAIDDPKVFEASSDPKLMSADVPLMYNIWLYFDVLCSAKSFS